MEPAIELADGFPIDELRVEYIRTRAPIFSQWPEAKRIFLPNGAVPKGLEPNGLIWEVVLA